jgi:UDP-N-acetyl-D-mannosaminuronate dehydrogenase
MQSPAFARPVETREYFDEVEARKYFVESHIARFAEFPRWVGRKVLEIGCGRLAGVVEGHLRPEGTVAILGLTYKPETDVVEEAFGLLLAKELAGRGRRVVGYDPAGNANAARELGGAAQVARSARESLDDADVMVVATPWRGFREIPAAHWSRHSPPRVVIDCWRILGHLREARGVLYFPLGTGDKPGTASRSQRKGDSC